jgi:hypothetical protein
MEASNPWDAETGKELLVLWEHGAMVRVVRWSWDGKMLVSGDESGVVWVREG